MFAAVGGCGGNHRGIARVSQGARAAGEDGGVDRCWPVRCGTLSWTESRNGRRSWFRLSICALRMC